MTTEPARSMRTSLEKSGRTFGQALPVIAGMLLLTSLALTLFSPQQFARLFGRNDMLDALLAAALGSIAAGPPLASYLLGGGVSLLALSSGALVYVGATHLLPQAEKEQRRYSLCALGAGILVAVIIVLSK
jgi:hypothetical protein